MPLNDSPGTPVWQAALCDGMRESFDAVRLQMDATQSALDREDVTALAIALNLGMAHYVKAVTAYDMLVAPIVEREP